ncbi:lipoprotein [Mesoplasma lactucae]|uniref:Uncharacterized protein n=1 Tax=Mesoplasma lactucae ATCC 49193 TaxID=81460 RepID=A0A291IRH9_9MOLU|nr:lipoprotein [Mesoplasma lactucae]ATG97297.1 hypothetical protein CP520_00795 [Mesoplasma lactucae ATCC 49193]ATZ20253.1 hypothetical protein MLACT_v1c04320 [Mesoplasma lactucae ATCC 49193]MCL8216424.1 hypothetical protein [Mesoplasma lactucae ATCC 49193]
MKKFLSILAAVGLTATTSTAVVACATESEKADVDAATKTASIKLDSKKAEKLKLVKKDNDGKWVAGDSVSGVSDNIKDNTVTVKIGDIAANGDVTVSVQATKEIAKNKTVKIQFKDKDNKNTKTLDLKLKEALPGTATGVKAITATANPTTITTKDGTSTITVDTEFTTAPGLNATSSDDNIATVKNNNNGTFTVTAKGNGTAHITISSTDTAKFSNGTVDVTVNIPAAKEAITISNTGTSITTKDGQTTITVGEKFKAAKGLKAESSKTGVATVTDKATDAGVFTVTAVGNGQTTITISADDFSPVTLDITVNIPAQD